MTIGELMEQVMKRVRDQGVAEALPIVPRLQTGDGEEALELVRVRYGLDHLGRQVVFLVFDTKEG